MIRQIFRLFLITLIISSCNFTSKTLIIADSVNDRYCLMESEFMVGGISYGVTDSLIRNDYGNPMMIIQEPDFNVETWQYNDFEISFCNNEMFYLKVQSQDLATPSGIRLGMSIKDAENIFGTRLNPKYGVGWHDFHNDTYIYEYQLANCRDEMYLILGFEDDEILTKFEFGNDLP